MTSKNIILIPARLESSRLKRKLLLNIADKSILQHTYESSLNSKMSLKTIILVDSIELFTHCKTFTDDVLMTSKKHKNGTERIYEYVKSSETNFNIVNMQADEPFTDHKLIDAIFKQLMDGNEIVTAVYEISDNIIDPNRVKVVLDKNDFALYFSRHEIPYNFSKKNKSKKNIHIGIYGYTTNSLSRINSYNDSYLGINENLEQLKFIENGEKIKVVISNNKTIGIDVIQDYELVKKHYEKGKY